MSGVSVPYILTEVTVVLNGEELRIRIAWALIEEVPMLLGRMDVFNKYRITFNEKNGWIDFEAL